MTEQEFHAAYPRLVGWIQNTLAQHATAAKPVASLGFSRLPRYYDAELLASSQVVVVASMPPLSTMGLPEAGGRGESLSLAAQERRFV